KRDLLRSLRNCNVYRRKKAVLRIRKMRDMSFCPFLLDALKNEPFGRNQWETPYHLIKTLTEFHYTPAYSHLHRLSFREFNATILYTALGEALIRLGRNYENDPSPLFDIMDRGNFILLDGAFRAVTLLHIRFAADVVEDILAFLAQLEEEGTEDYQKYFSNGGDPGWKSPSISRFIVQYLDDPCEETRKIAEEILHR
ncbi:MAG: hypothetical protein ACYTHM_07020, partial [Planctomycetota bacterium]